MKINFISKAFDRFNRYLTPHVSNAAKSGILRNAESVPQKETNLVKATVEELKTKEAKACNSFSAEEAIKYTIAPKEVARPQKWGKARAILNKKFNKNIPEYSNAEVIRNLKNISGEGLEVAEKSKNIFLKELGFPENFVEMEFGKNINGDIIAYFDIASGKMVYGNNFLKLSKNEQISYIRHELDHTAYLTDLCKSIGIENFKKIYLKEYPQVSAESFNVNFWEKAIKYAKDLSEKEKNSRLDAFENYVTNSKIKYLANHMEARAHKNQGAVLKSLSDKLAFITKDTVLLSKISYEKLDGLIGKIQAKYPEVDNEVLENLINNEINNMKRVSYTSELFESLVQKLEKMYPDVI